MKWNNTKTGKTKQ